MSDSYILLLAQLSKPIKDGQDLLQIFSNALSGKFEGEDTPVRSVLLLSPQSGIVWARGITVSEYLVSKKFDLGDSLTAEFEFPRSQPSFLVEIAPKRKNASIDLKKFERVFGELKPTMKGAVCMLLSDYRIVVKFANPDEAVKQCSAFIDPMKDDGTQTITSRTILIKEHVVMRSFYVGGSKSFDELERSHSESRGESLTDFLHSKFSHFKDRPVVMAMRGSPVSAAGGGGKGDGSGGSGGSAGGGVKDFNDEVNIACATHYDYRLLRNSPPVQFPNGAGSLILRVNIEHKIRKGAGAAGGADSSPPAPPLPPPSLPGPPALALPAAGMSTIAAATAGAAAATVTNVTPPPSAGGYSPAPATAYIFW